MKYNFDEIVPRKGTNSVKWDSRGYDDDKDIEFFGDAAMTALHVAPGQIAVFFPDDAHAPNIGLGNHRKLCIKIPVKFSGC